MIRFWAVVLFCFSWLHASSQTKVISSELMDSILVIETDIGKYHISSYGHGIIEVSFSEHGKEFSEESHAVIARRIPLKFVEESKKHLKIKSGEQKIVIHKSPFKLYFELENGTAFLNQNAISNTKIDSDSIQIAFDISKDEVLYGGGARALGMNRRGNNLELYNKAHYGYEERSELMNYTLPIFLSSKKYLVHVDNPTKGVLDLAASDSAQVRFDLIAGNYRYHVITGQNWDAILYNYTFLTGRQPLPPLFTFGNFASRFGYRSANQVNDVVRRFKENKIPLDAVILDLYWFGDSIKGTMGNLDFHLDSFPEPTAFLQNLRTQNIRPILITEPFILTSSNRWGESVQADILSKDSSGNIYTYDFYFGNTGLIDVFNPKARSWFWNIYKDLKKKGVDGFWGDLGEPEVHPSEIVHFGGEKADEVHNIFGHEWAKLIYEGYKTDFPEERLFNLMRSGAAGSQRFGLIPWSGDVNRTWGGLRSQVEIALQMNMQGLAYMHSDLGGFAGDYDDNELYTRWLQYGVFQPVFRPHAQEEVPSEPVFKDKETMKLAKQAIDLRYALLPYNYSLAYRNTYFGEPLMRPLFFDFPEDSVAQTTTISYLWGKSFLITPILHKEIESQEVIIPPKSVWIDYYTNERYENISEKSAVILKETNESSIPTLVRAGSIIPEVSPITNTAQYSPDKLIWKLYLDESVTQNEFTVYFDNDKRNLSSAFVSDEYKLSYERNDNGLFVKVYKNGILHQEFYDNNVILDEDNRNITVVISNVD